MSHAYGGAHEAAPLVFQETNGMRRNVRAFYRLQNGIVSFEIGNYDKTQTLVIDPLSRSWSRFYGDSRLDRAYSSVFAADGSLYVVGVTQSTPFPVTPGAFQTAFGGANDAFITKFNTSGTVVWATLAGGGSVDLAAAVALNPVTQNIVVCGSTSSSNFPTFNAQQPTYGGNGDGFIMQFTPSGGIVWSSYLGGTLLDDAYDVNVGPTGEIYVAGGTFSPGLATAGQLTLGGNRDAFVARITSAGAVQWFSYYGGSGDDAAFSIDIGPMGNIAIGGSTNSSNLPVSGGPQLTLNGPRDGFLARMTPSAAPIWSTYLGGSGEDVVTGVTVFTNSNVVVAGWTNSSNFPTLNAFQSTYGGTRDAFVAKYNNATQTLLWSTYYGGSDIEEAYDITIADNGGVHVVGSTRSSNFPVTPGAEHVAYAGNTDGFLVTLLNNGVRDYATYIGGSATEIARGVTATTSGSLVAVVGQTGSNSFSAPISGTRVGSDDAFIITYNVNIVAPCQVTLQASQTTVCPGASVTITATGPAGNNYSWTGPGGFSATGSLITVNPTQTSIYTVNVTGTGCLNSSATITINVHPTTNLTASSSANNICGGQTVTLSVTPTNLSNYVWSGPNGPVGVGTSVSVSPGVTTTYTVNAIDANGCNASGVVTVTVAALATTITPAQPIICIGQSVTLTASPANTYLWSTGQTTQSITVSPTQTTTYTVGTTTGICSSTATVTVQVNLPPVAVASLASPACVGQPVSLTGSGASTYSWFVVNTQSALFGQNVSFTPANTGSYTVYLTGSDPAGCQDNDTLVFTVHPLPTFDIDQGSSITVCAEQNFTLSASNPSLTYQWSTNQTGQTIVASVVSSQTITVTGTDANGCSATRSINVNAIPVPQGVTATAFPSTVCAGQTVNLIGSNHPDVVLYEWVWNNGQSVQTGQFITVTPSVTTTYTLNAYNAQNCPKSVTVTVTVNPLPNVAISTPTPSICIGQCATLTGSGAIAYTWTWPGGNSAVGETLQVCPTTTTSYTLTGIDANGCQNVAAITVAVNPLPTITIAGPSAICGGTSATLTASGAVSYSWSPNFGLNTTTGATVVANPTGTTTYTVTGTDANGCVNSTTFTLVVHPTPVVSVAAGDAELCIGESTLLVASSSISAAYSWSHTSSTSNVQSVSPTETTTYTVTATTAEGCSATAAITIVVHPLPPVAITASQTTICLGQSVTLTASGAATYAWSTSQTEASISVTPPTTGTFTYSVTGTDANGCTNSASTTITVRPTPDLTVSQSASEICLGQSVTFTASGNSTSYLWTWDSNSASGAVLTVTPATSGTFSYTVTGTNEFGCTTSRIVSVSVRPVPNVQVNKTDVTCHGGSNGAIALSLTGGEAPHTITWSGPGGYSSSVQNPSGLTAGIYTYTVTTAAGCVVSGSIEILQPPPFNIETLLDQPSCNGLCDGAITVNVNNASVEPVVVLRDGVTNNVIAAANGFSVTFSGALSGIPLCLSAGSYRVQVFVNACSDQVDFELGQPDVLDATAELTNEVCFGDGLGSIDLTVTGGTAPYTFAWTGPSSYSADSEDLANLTTGGVYTVFIVDANGCELTRDFTLVGPTEPLAFADATVTDITCANAALGAIDITVVGGVQPYTFLWTGPNGYQNTNEDLTNLIPGTYTGTVTDAVGCVISASLEVRALDVLYANIAVTNIRCYGENTGVITMTPIGGTPPYNISWTGPNGFSSSDANLTGLFAGTYELTLTDATGCVWLAEVEVFQEAELTFDIQISGNLCYGVFDGEIDLTVFGGGVTPYVYVWSGDTLNDVVTTEDLIDVGPGTYDLLIIDGNGCINFASVDFVEPPAFLIESASITNLSCNGDSDGAIDLDVFGPNLTFQWSNGATTEDVSGLTAGAYTVIITSTYTLDGNPVVCSIESEYTIQQPNALQIEFQVVNVACHGDATGSIDVTPSGGTPPYNFSWSNGQNTEDLSDLTAGDYQLTITDANGCQSTFASIAVSQPDAPLSIASATITDVLCHNEATGAIDVTIAGGTPPYSFSWLTPSGNIIVSEDLNGIPAGQYTGTITDANGCSISGTLTVNNPAPITAQVQVVNVLCFGDNTGVVSVTANGGA
ncbi:MAG: SBBP repeat-containing protein, partial [Bacteroidia bacterium]|nr:SBBP repeat-containing protein [Bacteroidia bacterium]